MSYFKELPNISYVSRLKDLSRNDERIEVKNLFKRAKLREDIESAITAFEYYEIPSGMRPDTLAEKLYGDSELDWVVLITNNIINVKDQWPLSNDELYNYLIEKYGSEEALDDIHHYETLEVKDEYGRSILKEGATVDETFYNAPIYEEDTTSEFLPESVPGRQATAIVRNIGNRLSSVRVTVQGSGFEEAPEISILDLSGSGSGATATAGLSSTGYVKRIEITNSGSGYDYPPIITLGGGLEGQSATAEITGGQLSAITLDGVKFDTTNSDQIYEFGGGTRIVANGSGTGRQGGFNVGGPHLRFGESSGLRFVTLNPINATAINTVRVYAIRGNGSNGGETPDIRGQEDLRLEYQITDVGEEPDINEWVDLGVVISAVNNGTGTGVLDNYDFDLTGTEVQAENVYFRLVQLGNSGPEFDHYGIVSVTFIGDASLEIEEPTITIEKNPLQSSDPAPASAQIVLGKRLTEVTLEETGLGYNPETTIVNINGGEPQTIASAEVTVEPVFDVDIIDGGQGYSSAYSLFNSEDGFGMFGEVTVEDGSITSVEITNQGSSYIDPPKLIFSPPNNVSIINEGDLYPPGNDTWRYNGTVWEKKVVDYFKYSNTSGSIVNLKGNQVSRPVTNYEYETKINQAKSRIRVLKKSYLPVIITDMRNIMKYDDSSQYESQILKRAYNPRLTGI